MSDLEPDAAPPPRSAISMRSILLKTCLGLALMVGVLMAGLVFFRPEIEAVARLFVDTLGGPGVFLGYFLPDAFTLPIPNDAVAFFGLTGGLGFWTVVAWGTAGSLAGGATGYGVGRLLQRTLVYKVIMARKGDEVRALMERYGPLALAIAAITPVPYSLACWASGAGNMRLRIFFAVSLLRFPKVAIYLYLIQLGQISVT